VPALMGGNGANSDTDPVDSEEVSVEEEAVEAGVAEGPPRPAEGIEPVPRLEESELVNALDRIDRRLGESQRLLEHQQELADRLHTENQSLRAGELRGAQLPLVRDFLRLHDDVSRMREAAADDDGDLRIVQDSLVDMLARNGVIAFGPDSGVEFDPRAHSVAAIEITTDEGLNRTVAGVVKQGFRWDSGDVIRVAEVKAYRFSAPS
jgi:molecular chaperone GrpE (heat shock protein)